MQTIILAGGNGTRLWPLSREYFPKQFLKLPQLEDKSLFQLTFLRALKISSLKDIIVVTNEKQKFLVMGSIEELGYKGFDEENILVEPVAKNTLPAISYAMQHVEDKALILSSDHLIKEDLDLISKIDLASKLADNDLVVFGITPTKPHTGYGYIDYENNKVRKFIEKPNLEKAEEYIQKGFLWNSGIFLFSKTSFSIELEKYNYSLYKIYVNGKIEKNFENLESESIDYGLLEKSNNISVVPLEIKWSDLGSFDSMYDEFSKDSQQNVLTSNVVANNSKNNLIYSQEEKIVVLNDVDDLIVVDTDDSLLITKKNNSQKVKEVVKELQKKNDSRIETHTTVFRPWGNYIILEDKDSHKVKRLCILPNKALSLQKHHKRAEHWTVVKGRALVVNGDEEFILEKNQSTYIPKNTIHRLSNPYEEKLEIIETQSGEYFGEDDIIRYEDNYGRN